MPSWFVSTSRTSLPVELKKFAPWLTATRSEPSESFAMPSGKSRPLANVVIRKSFELTPGPWTVKGCAKET